MLLTEDGPHQYTLAFGKITKLLLKPASISSTSLFATHGCGSPNFLDHSYWERMAINYF